MIVGLVIEEPIGITIEGYRNMTPEKLWNIVDKRGQQLHALRMSVVVNMARVMTTKAIIHNWEIKFDVELDTEIFPLEQFKMALYNAGRISGIGGMRPEKGTGSYGRFLVQDIKEL